MHFPQKKLALQRLKFVQTTISVGSISKPFASLSRTTPLEPLPPPPPPAPAAATRLAHWRRNAHLTREEAPIQHFDFCIFQHLMLSISTSRLSSFNILKVKC